MLLLIVLLASSRAAALYVRSDGADAVDCGLSVQHPCRTMQYAVQQRGAVELLLFSERYQAPPLSVARLAPADARAQPVLAHTDLSAAGPLLALEGLTLQGVRITSAHAVRVSACRVNEAQDALVASAASVTVERTSFGEGVTDAGLVCAQCDAVTLVDVAFTQCRVLGASSNLIGRVSGALALHQVAVMLCASGGSLFVNVSMAHNVQLVQCEHRAAPALDLATPAFNVGALSAEDCVGPLVRARADGVLANVTVVRHTGGYGVSVEAGATVQVADYSVRVLRVSAGALGAALVVVDAAYADCSRLRLLNCSGAPAVYVARASRAYVDGGSIEGSVGSAVVLEAASLQLVAVSFRGTQQGRDIACPLTSNVVADARSAELIVPSNTFDCRLCVFPPALEQRFGCKVQFWNPSRVLVACASFATLCIMVLGVMVLLRRRHEDKRWVIRV